MQYDERLLLQPFMSEGQFGPTYSLYGVICHAGGGPNSGHYYAFVKSKEGRWFEMNDETVQATSPPTDKRNAYMLFYMLNKGQTLEAAVKTPVPNGLASTSSVKGGLAAGMKKKTMKPKDTGDDEDQGVKVTTPLIGPLLPSAEILKSNKNASQLSSSLPADPQASALKSKIKAVSSNNDKARKELESLGDYESDSDEEGKKKPATNSVQDLQQDDRMDGDAKGKQKRKSISDEADEPPRPSSPLTQPRTSSPIPASSFYASVNKNKKRRISEAENQNQNRRSSSAIGARTMGYVTSNPYGKPFVKRKRMGI